MFATRHEHVLLPVTDVVLLVPINVSAVLKATLKTIKQHVIALIIPTAYIHIFLLCYTIKLRFEFHSGCVQGDQERHGKTGKSMKRASRMKFNPYICILK